MAKVYVVCDPMLMQIITVHLSEDGAKKAVERYNMKEERYGWSGFIIKARPLKE